MNDARCLDEFIYKLNGKYYIIGARIYKECFDRSIIELYENFETIMQDNGFYDITDNEGLRKLAFDRRNLIGEAFKTCYDACSMGIQGDGITVEEKIKRDDLCFSHREEIDKQIKRWKMASKCWPAWETVEEG